MKKLCLHTYVCTYIPVWVISHTHTKDTETSLPPMSEIPREKQMGFIPCNSGSFLLRSNDVLLRIQRSLSIMELLFSVQWWPGAAEKRASLIPAPHFPRLGVLFELISRTYPWVPHRISETVPFNASAFVLVASEAAYHWLSCSRKGHISTRQIQGSGSARHARSPRWGTGLGQNEQWRLRVVLQVGLLLLLLF